MQNLFYSKYIILNLNLNSIGVKEVFIQHIKNAKPQRQIVKPFLNVQTKNGREYFNILFEKVHHCSLAVIV